MPDPHNQREPIPEELFAQLVKERREALGWSQEELARRVSVAIGEPMHQTAITRIEGLRRGIRLGEALEIAHVLGIDLSALFTATREQPPDRAAGVAGMLVALQDRRHEHLQRIAQCDAEIAMVTTRRDSALTSLANIERSIDDLTAELHELRRSAEAGGKRLNLPRMVPAPPEEGGNDGER